MTKTKSSTQKPKKKEATCKLIFTEGLIVKLTEEKH